MRAVTIPRRYTGFNVDLGNNFEDGYGKNIQFTRYETPDPTELWLKPVPGFPNRFAANETFVGCVLSEDYLYKVPIIGIESKGEIKVCGTSVWYVVIETSHRKDINCDHGCFPVDDLIDINWIDHDLRMVGITSELNGGAFEWFLGALLELLNPLMLYLLNAKLHEDGMD